MRNLNGNLMATYLGEAYSDNHLKNFCLYWMKGRETKPKWGTKNWKARFDDWRRKNDLDCLYFNRDLRADTLMSAWTPISWVVNCLNRGKGIRFCKEPKNDPNYFLRLLAEDRDKYLPTEHELVQLLDRFLELAELRCNYILLPNRAMNRQRYNYDVSGKRRVRLYDEVPPMLYHIFDWDWFGKYFEQTDSESNVENVQTLDAVKWVKRERLEAGFKAGIIDQDHVIPLLNNFQPEKAKDLRKEAEIEEALTYMINLLEARMKAMEKTPYIMLAEDYELDCGMGYYTPYKYGEALMEDGTIIPIFSETEFNIIEPKIFSVKSPFYRIYTGRGIQISDAYVRKDYKEMFESKRKKGRTYFSILHEMAKEVVLPKG